MKKYLTVLVMLFLLFSNYSCSESKKTYNITYMLEEIKLNLEPSTYTSGEELTLPEYQKDGYEFIGWFDNKELSGTPIEKVSSTSNSNLTFYAKVTKAATYKISYYYNDTLLNLSPNTYTANTNTKLPTPNKVDGKTFSGWYLDKDFTNGPVTNIQKTDSGDKVFYAKYDNLHNVELQNIFDNLNNYEYSFSYKDEVEKYNFIYQYDNASYYTSTTIDGSTREDFLIYDEEIKDYVFYGNYEEGGYFYVLPTSLFYSFCVNRIDFLRIDTLHADDFTLQDGKYVYTGIDITESVSSLLNIDDIYFEAKSFSLTLTNNQLTRINITSTIYEEGVRYNQTYQIDLSNFGNASVKAPDDAVNFDKDTEPDTPIEPEHYSTSEIYNLSNGTDIFVYGQIIGIIGNNAFISDGEKVVYVYLRQEDILSYFEYGDWILVEGSKNTYNGQVQVTNILTIELYTNPDNTNLKPIDITTLDTDYLATNNIHYVNTKSLTITDIPTDLSIGYNDITLKVSDGTNELPLFISKYLDNDYRTTLIRSVRDLQVGDKLYLADAVIGMFKNYQLYITENTIVSFGEYTKPVTEKIIVNHEEITVDNGTTLTAALESITVSVKLTNGIITPLNNSEYTYAYSNYEPYVAGTYVITFSYKDTELNKTFNATVKITVKEDESNIPNSFIPNQSDMKVLDQIADSFDITHGMPTTGNSKALAIPISFSDFPAKPSMKREIEMALFGTEEETGWESLSTYYYKSSYGKLNISGTVLDPYNTGKTSTYYETRGEVGLNELIKATLEYYDDFVDYSEYDSDSDGYIDALYFIYSAPVDYDDADFYWAYATQYLTDDYEYYDQVEADYFFFAGMDFLHEKTASGTSLNINAETFIHETGHILGLDDYYDFDPNKGPIGGLGGGDMMDYNVGDHNPFTKIILGWITPTVVIGSVDSIDLSSFEKSGDCVIVCNKWNGTYFDEYLVIDYYTPTGLNKLEAGYNGLFNESGVRIYHVDATLNNYIDVYSMFNICLYNNGDASHKLIKLIEADGSNDIEDLDEFSSNDDLFQAGDTFSNHKWYNKKLINFSITINSIDSDKANISITY